jgi:hypothetical protein
MPKSNTVRAVIRRLNLPYQICAHALGRSHSHAHRITVGVIIMAIGVWIAKQFHYDPMLHYICDLSGYGLHGIGLTPIIEWMAESEQDSEA